VRQRRLRVDGDFCQTAAMSTPPPLTVDDLLAREEITDVLKRLARGTDRLDEELMVSCYHPDGYDDHNLFRGPADEFASWCVRMLSGHGATMHFLASPYIRIDGDVAQADTYCIAHHISAPDAAGNQSDMVIGVRYVDRFERRDGRWLIAKRVCSFDWTYTVPIDPATTWPFQDDFTVGVRDRTDISYQVI
jgi:hypothetical protein